MDGSSKARTSRVASCRVSDFSVFHCSGWSGMDRDSSLPENTQGQEAVVPEPTDPEANLTNVTVGDNEVILSSGDAGRMLGGTHSWSASPQRVSVGMGPSSDSTVSNPNLTAGEGGTDSWRVKRVELACKLQKAKEREKVLKAQIGAQRERIQLEMQEKENTHLEAEMKLIKSCIFSVTCLFGFFNVCFTSFQLAELLSSQIPWQLIEPGESHFDGALFKLLVVLIEPK